MGPTRPFLLIFESRVQRQSFCGIKTVNDYMYSASWQIVNGPPGLGLHTHTHTHTHIHIYTYIHIIALKKPFLFYHFDISYFTSCH